MTDYQGLLDALDAALFGLEEEKREFVTSIKINESLRDSDERILCFVGPRGVGKKALSYAYATAIGSQPLLMAVGSVEGGSIPGYGTSRIGELAGMLIHHLDRCRDTPTVIVLDGVEYLNLNFQNKLAGSLREVLAISHEHALRMRHLDQPLDFSNVRFVATARDSNLIGKEMLNQLQLIHFAGYTDEEKVEIGQRFLLPAEINACGIGADVSLTAGVIHDIVRQYTNEIGVSELKGSLQKLLRRLVFESAIHGDGVYSEPIGSTQLHRHLGHPLYQNGRRRIQPEVGMMSTLGRSDGRGILADLEAVVIDDGAANVVLTGNMDGVFRETIMVALAHLRHHRASYGLSDDVFATHTIHMNMMPAGVVKSGVSAGLAVVLVLVSALNNLPLRSDISAMGEISLHGDVRRIGGVYEKLLGASRLGIKTVLYPRENQIDVSRLSCTIDSELQLVPVDTIEEACRVSGLLV